MERTTQESGSSVTGTGSDVRATSPTIASPTFTGVPVYPAGGIATDTKFCTTQFDAVTGTTGTTLTNIVGLTGFTLTAAGVYRFDMFLNGVATANSGHKIGFALTTATLTSINAGALALLASTMAYTQSTTSTALHGATTATLGLRISGRMIVNAGGTLAVQAAQNAAHADTTSVYVGSWLTLTRIS